MTFYVENIASEIYELYALKRSWTENKATWAKASAGTNWQMDGAQGVNDREDTILGTVLASATGPTVVTLNAAGVARVQSWINSPSTNHGFLIQDYLAADGIDLTSSEGGTTSRRPTLTITYQ